MGDHYIYITKLCALTLLEMEAFLNHELMEKFIDMKKIDSR